MRAAIIKSAGDPSDGTAFAVRPVIPLPFEEGHLKELPMAENIEQKLKDAGYKVGEKAEEAGQKVGHEAGKAAEWAKDKAHQAGDKIEQAGDAAKKKIDDATK
jgi:ribosome recycling factor